MTLYFNPTSPIKKEIRLIGIDDSPFTKHQGGQIPVIGAVHRGGSFLEAVLSTTIEIDGDDATEKIAEMITKSRHHKQIRVILLNGIAVGGFNVVDIKHLANATKKPVIIIVRQKPNINKISKAINNVHNGNVKLCIIKKAGNVKKLKVHNGVIHFQCTGISEKHAREIITLSATHSMIPEPIRSAHLIVAGLVKGESRGRA